MSSEVVVREKRKWKEKTDKVVFFKYDIQKSEILSQVFSTYAKSHICKLLTDVPWLDWVIAHVGKKAIIT